jgi:hypothetical protein
MTKKIESWKLHPALGGLVDCLRAIPDSGSFFRIS